MKKTDAVDWAIVALALITLALGACMGMHAERGGGEATAVPPTTYNEAMGEMSSRGTALLSCLETRIEMVCSETGPTSTDCQTIRMAVYSQMFSRIRDTNRCLYGSSTGNCAFASTHTVAEIRTVFLKDIAEAETRCNTIEDDASIQGIIDEAFKLKMQRLAEIDRAERARR